MKNRILPKLIHEHIHDMISIEDTIGCSSASIYHYSGNNKDLYLKIDKCNKEFAHEQAILQWLEDKLPVPKIVAQCKEDGYGYLLMTKAEGEMSCSEHYLCNPVELVRLLSEGIKMLQKVEVSDCPFDCTLKNKLNIAKQRIEHGQIDMSDWEKDTLFNTPDELYNYLVINQHEEDLVFSHGDYCLPNIFLSNGKVSGFIDLGRAGISDKWKDIALCVRSLKHNLKNEKYIDLFFEYLNIDPNYEKISYYILLDELF